MLSFEFCIRRLGFLFNFALKFSFASFFPICIKISVCNGFCRTFISVWFFWIIDFPRIFALNFLSYPNLTWHWLSFLFVIIVWVLSVNFDRSSSHKEVIDTHSFRVLLAVYKFQIHVFDFLFANDVLLDAFIEKVKIVLQLGN